MKVLEKIGFLTVQLDLIHNIVPMGIKDVLKTEIVSKNLFRNHEELQGNKIADFININTKNLGKDWDDPEITFENKYLMEIQSLGRI